MNKEAKENPDDNDLYRQMFEIGIIGMAQVSLNWKWMRVNAKVCEITGYSEEELLSKSFIDITHPDDVGDNMDAALALLRKEKEIFTLEKRYIRKDGNVTWVKLTARLHWKGDEPQYYIASIDDINERKVLQTERERLYDLPDHLLCTLNNKSEFISVNRAFTNILGYARDELLGKTIWNFIHPGDLDISIATEQMGNTTVIHGFENRFRSRSGEYRWLRWTGTIINGINYGAAVDVTELKLVEQRLRISEQQYKLLYETMLQGVIYRDSKGNIISMNPAAEAIIGKPASELIGRSVNDIPLNLIHEDGTSYPPDESAATQTLRTGKVVKNTIGIYNEKKGGIRWVNISSVPLFREGEQEPYQVYTVLDDVTETKLAEETLRESEETFRTLADNIQNLAWMANPDGWIFWYNQQWYDYTGTTLEEMQGWGWEKVHHPDHIKSVVEFLKDAWSKGEPWEMTFPLRRKDGVYQWFLTRAFAVRDKNGTVIRWIGTNTNIDEQKRAMEQKDEFIGIASHELKTPLTSIKAYMQLLERLITDPVQGSYVAKTNDYVNKLQLLIADLLDVSKIQAGKLQFHFSEFNFNELLAETIESILHTYKSHRIINESSLNGTVVGDKLRLEQVLVNFFTNAIKYSPGADKIIVKAWNKDEHVFVSITDFGIGIPKDKQPKLFERFYRVQEQSNKFSGLGIGLYIAAEIVKRHNGQVWVESEEGKGSTFYFTIPVRQQ